MTLEVAISRGDAQALHGEIVKGCVAIRQAWVWLAGKLYEFHRQQAWLALGHPTFAAWLRDPQVELNRAQADRMIRAWREVVVERGIEPEQLRGLDLLKVIAVLPSVTDGRKTVGEALADCRSLRRSELQALYGGEPTRPRAPVEIPRCPNCRSLLHGWRPPA